jgi:DNA-binding NarL/FixJ family response regulator
MNTTISLVLIEDNRLLREGIAALIREQSDFRVLVASADIDEALQEVREAKRRVVLLDLGLKNGNSLRLAGTVHREVPEAESLSWGCCQYKRTSPIL